MKIYILRSKRGGLIRLIVGGLHGREGKSIGPLLKQLTLERGPKSGMLIVVPSLCAMSKYVSTLNNKYFNTRGGRRLLKLLHICKPDVYVEVHCYARRAYRSLTSSLRMIRKGVPRFIELEGGVLIGSPSPQILTLNLFKLGITFEVPCNSRDWGVILRLLRIVRDENSVEGVLDKLMMLYPKQMAEAIELFNIYEEVSKFKLPVTPCRL
ncbi:MAG: DUF2119 domain-containing protein [Candidatus Nezhaarchaeota archaeon]|nr:DUF2119 domain-containing protein [Candidatus Nezhaarchaeota archaeon]MCX8142506.1 DUF2119 domain-containing protein [Candidatus Nezhaarchaeota archaeon]MDW8050521.1 DUF2119 family protein [Nitrososphaerota archaeon]